jgi:hypothetical protein
MLASPAHAPQVRNHPEVAPDESDTLTEPIHDEILLGLICKYLICRQDAGSTLEASPINGKGVSLHLEIAMTQPCKICELFGLLFGMAGGKL